MRLHRAAARVAPLKPRDQRRSGLDAGNVNVRVAPQRVAACVSRDVLLRLLDQLALEDVGCSPMAEAVKGLMLAGRYAPCHVARRHLVGLDAG